MKWYLKPVAIVVAILAAGPFAIPLVWMSPAFKKWQKVVITIALILLTVWLVKISAEAYKILMKEMKALQDAM